MYKFFLFLGVFGWAISSCTVTNSDELIYELEPQIFLEEVSMDTLGQFVDQLTLNIRYQDGDGDLGTSDPDVNLIVVQDSRLDNPDYYYLPPLAPEDARISIEGSFNLTLSPTFLLGNGSKEELVYSIYLLDRAGNQSNTVETPTILVVE